MRARIIAAILLGLLALAAAQTDGSPPVHPSNIPVEEPEAAPVPPVAPPSPPPPPPSRPPPKREQPAAPSSAPKKGMPVMSLRKILPKDTAIKPGGVDVVKQVDVLLEALPSGVAFLAANSVFKYVMRNVLGITKFPHALVGMFVFFGAMCSMKPADADKVVSFFKPGLELITAFLPAFFAPGLLLTPLAARGTSGLDFAKFVGVIFLNLPVVYVMIGYAVMFLQKLSGNPVPKPLPRSSAAFKAWFSPALEKIFGTATAASALGSLLLPGVRAIEQTFFFTSTFFSFIFASRLPERLPRSFAEYWHPLLTTFLSSTAMLMGYGVLRGMSLCDVLARYTVGGGSPTSAAGNLILFFLEPAIISFSFGLYARRKLLVENALAIMGGAFTAAFFGIFVSAGLCRVFNPPRQLKLALIPRATAALAVVQAAIIGGPIPLTTVNCCFIGIAGANFGPAWMNLMGIANPIARGVATGGSGLALASAALAANDPAAFPFGALAMAVTSTISTILLSFPPYLRAVMAVMGD